MKTRAVVVTFALAVLAGCSAPADPVTVVALSDGSQTDPVDIEFQGTTDFDFAEITLQPGASTGPHCHYGNVIGVIESGELTHYAPTHPGGVYVYKAGESLVEGPGYVHEGVNEGDVPVVLYVTYVTPDGKPLAEKDLTHCDPQVD